MLTFFFFTMTRFFMLEFHSLLCKWSSSAFSSNTSSLLSDADFTQDIMSENGQQVSATNVYFWVELDWKRATATDILAASAPAAS